MTNEDIAVQLWADHITEPTERTLEALVLHYQPLAAFLARRAKMKAPPHQEYEELLSFAYDGLLDAIQRYDYTKGTKFDTYATRRITGEIVDNQRKLDPLSRRDRTSVRAWERAVEELTIELEGRRPTLEELAERLGTDVADIRLRGLMAQSMSVPLGKASAPDDTLDPFEGSINFVAGGSSSQDINTHRESTDDPGMDVNLKHREILGALARRLPLLTDRERTLVILYYVEGRSYAEIGEQLGLKENRCRQIRKAVLASLTSAKLA